MSKAVRYVDAAGGVDHDARRIEDLACAHPRPHPKGATAVPALSILSRMGPRLFRSMGPLGPGPSRDRRRKVRVGTRKKSTATMSQA